MLVERSNADKPHCAQTAVLLSLSGITPVLACLYPRSTTRVVVRVSFGASTYNVKLRPHKLDVEAWQASPDAAERLRRLLQLVQTCWHRSLASTLSSASKSSGCGQEVLRSVNPSGLLASIPLSIHVC